MQTGNFEQIQLGADVSPVDGDVFMLSHSIDSVTGLILQSRVPVKGLKFKLHFLLPYQNIFLSFEIPSLCKTAKFVFIRHIGCISNATGYINRGRQTREMMLLWLFE